MKAGILGASGYTGSELLRLLAGHPEFEVAVASAHSHAGETVGTHTPSLAAAYPGLVYDGNDLARFDGLDLVFCGLPHGESQRIVPELRARVGLVVDLAADFRLHDAAISIDLPHVVEQRHGLAGRAHAGLFQPLDRGGNGRADGRIQILQRKTLRDADAKPGQRQRFKWRKIFTRHHRVGLGAIDDALRQRTDGIERGTQGKGAGGRHALATRLETDDAAEGRRDAHRAAGVAADGDVGHAVADRDRRAGR